jgi:hypothetical protein
MKLNAVVSVKQNPLLPVSYITFEQTQLNAPGRKFGNFIQKN